LEQYFLHDGGSRFQKKFQFGNIFADSASPIGGYNYAVKKAPQAKAWGYTGKACLRRLEFHSLHLVRAGGLCSYSLQKMH
jgi:hypothetical protein